MAFLQVKNVLSQAVEFHKTLENFYLHTESTSDKETVKILANYMARHEKVLEEELSQVTEEQQKQIADEWIKYESEYITCKCFEELTINQNSGVDDIIDAGLKLNQCLIDFYHHMSEIAPTKEVEALFLNLETMEIAEKKKLARTRGM